MEEVVTTKGLDQRSTKNEKAVSQKVKELRWHSKKKKTSGTRNLYGLVLSSIATNQNQSDHTRIHL